MKSLRTVFCVLALSLTTTIEAQQININSWNSVRNMQNPCDTVTLEIIGDMDATYAQGPVNVSISGNTIAVEIIMIYGFATQPVSPNIPWSVNAELGSLAKGNYTLNITSKLSTVQYDFKSYNFTRDHIFTYLSDTLICYGDSILINGSVIGMMNPTYAWSNGKSTQNIYASLPGMYSLIATGSNCTVKDTMTLNRSSEIPYILGPDTTVCIGDFFKLGGGPSYYVYLWSDNSTIDSTFWMFQNAGSEVIWVDVTDSNLCTSRQEIIVTVEDCDTSSTLIVENQNEMFRIYPNPTTGYLSIESTTVTKSILYRLHGSSGQLYLEEEINSDNSVEIYIPGSPGIYFLEVIGDNQEKEFFRIIKTD